MCAEARREGSAALLRFAHTGGGLVLDEGDQGFRLAGADGVFYPARAELIAPDTLRVTAPENGFRYPE